MNNDPIDETPSLIIPILRSDFLSLLVLGGLVGLVVFVLGSALDRFIFDVYLCQNEASSQCANAGDYSAIVASVIAGIAALGAMIRLRVYRPLLVLIASLISLWGVVQVSWALGWYIGVPVAIALYALAFGLYTWIARIREFWISLVVIIILVVAVRIALTI